MKNALSQNLILCGFKSSGKTFLGTLLAKEQACLFFDADHLIEDLYQKKFQEKCTCRQISIKLGENGFRMLEKGAIDQLKDVANAVIALGGGAVLDLENCARIQKLGKIIYLEADKETIQRRIFCSGLPSFLDPLAPEESFERMYASRQSIYEKVCALKVDMRGKTNRQVLDELMAIQNSLGRF